MFRYESVNSTRKFTIVAEIVSLLKKIYKRDAPFRAVFKVKTLAVLFSAYPREMKHIPRYLNLPPFCRCLFLRKWCNHSHARARGLSMRTHLTAVEIQMCPGLNANEIQIKRLPGVQNDWKRLIQIPYDKHHEVSSLVKSHQNTHNSVKYEVLFFFQAVTVTNSAI